MSKEESKPDFEKLATESDVTDTHDAFLGFQNGCEKVWNDYVSPLQKEISELRKEISENEKEILRQGDEIQLLESQLDKAKELLTYVSQRMTTARDILTERDGQPDCWQMLNSENIESFLKS